MKRFTKIFFIGVLLYCVSSLLTFSWTARLPWEYSAPFPPSFLCGHPFGMPLNIVSWENHCVSDDLIVLGQIINLIVWILVAWLVYYVITNYKRLKAKFEKRHPLTFPVMLILGTIIVIGGMYVASFVAWFSGAAVLEGVQSHIADIRSEANKGKPTRILIQEAGFGFYFPPDRPPHYFGQEGPDAPSSPSLIADVKKFSNKRLFNFSSPERKLLLTVEAIKTEPTTAEYPELGEYSSKISIPFGTNQTVEAYVKNPSTNCIPGGIVRTSCQTYFIYPMPDMHGSGGYYLVLTGFINPDNTLDPDLLQILKTFKTSTPGEQLML